MAKPVRSTSEGIFPARWSKSSRLTGDGLYISTAFAIYFVLWWVVLFLDAAFGVRTSTKMARARPHRSRRADRNPEGRKLIWTTVISRPSLPSPG